MHGDNVGYAIWEVPHLEVAVGSPLVRGDRSRIDPNPSRFRLDVLQVRAALNSGLSGSSAPYANVTFSS